MISKNHINLIFFEDEKKLIKKDDEKILFEENKILSQFYEINKEFISDIFLFHRPNNIYLFFSLLI